MRRLRGLLADTRPLQVPAYRRLFTAQIVTVIGAQLTVVTVPAQIYSMTGSSAYVGLTGVFGLVPLVVFGLYGGSLADHFDRRWILTVTTWGLIITSALFFAQAALGNTNVWLLLAIFSLQQAFFAVNQPTRSAVLPRIDCPTLVACGRQDGWSPLSQHEEMAAAIRDAELAVIEDSGHMSTVEAPAAVTGVLSAWLRLGVMA